MNEFTVMSVTAFTQPASAAYPTALLWASKWLEEREEIACCVSRPFFFALIAVVNGVLTEQPVESLSQIKEQWFLQAAVSWGTRQFMLIRTFTSFLQTLIVSWHCLSGNVVMVWRNQ